MIKIITAILILVSVSQIHSQALSGNELDSLYNLFTFVRGVNASDKMQQILDENPDVKKCGLGLVTSIKQNLNNFSHEQQTILSKLLDRPQLQNSVITSNGFFRVHYDLTGVNALGYDINLLLQALDSVYKFEINFLGYPFPPSDGSAGGDDKYDIYVMNILDYGYTQPENEITSSHWSSFMVIDNDFGSEFYTHGIDAARATVAHEFHHAIQMGNYAPINPSEPYRDSDRFFYELTSTAFEEFVFDDVNDYYAYMPAYFNNPAKSFSQYAGYDIAIWNIYLQNNFGFEIIKNQWQQIPNKSALEAIYFSLFQQGTTLGNELNKFGIWTYFTKSRAVPNRYFEEANNYPLLAPTATVSFTPPSQTYDMAVGPVANYFLKINLPSPDGVFHTIITNSDYQKTIGQTFPFSFSVYQDSVSGIKVISENYSVTFSNDNLEFWNNAGILNDIVVYGDSNYSITNLEGDTYAYPMPYKKTSSGNIRIAFQAELNLGDEVDLNIYSAGLESVFLGEKSIQYIYLKGSKKYCEVFLENNDINFSSGVYIYVIKSGEDIYKGKLVIFND